MNGFTMMMRMLKGGARPLSFAVVVAALLFLFAGPVAAQATNARPLHAKVDIDSLVVDLVPGQTLRITVFNPDKGEVSAQVKVFDLKNVLVAKTANVVIAGGASHTFNIDRADIKLAGELGTGRVQTRARAMGRPVKLLYTKADDMHGTRSKARINRLPASMELVDNLTGKTITTLVPAVQEGKPNDR